MKKNISLFCNFFLGKDDGSLITCDIEKKTFFYVSFLIYFLMSLGTWFLISYVNSNYGLPDHNVFDFILKNSWYYILITVLFVGPLLEEISFRLFLRYSRINISLSIGGVCYYIISIISNSGFYKISSIFIYKVIIISILVIIVYRFLSNTKFEQHIKNFLQNNLLIIMYCSILIFGLVHVSNIKLENYKSFLILPVLISPQLSIALVSSVLRLKCGFKYSFFFHFLVNLIPTSLLLLVKFIS